MNPETKKMEVDLKSVETAIADQARLGVNTEQPGTLSQVTPPAGFSEPDWQTIKEKLSWLLNEFPDRLGDSFGEYKKPIIALGVVVAAIPFVTLAAAILEVINSLPFLAPTFELIGFGYTSWFIYRYLLFASRRQEFTQDIESLKQEVLGAKDTE
jgi:hypothetical protein